MRHGSPITVLVGLLVASPIWFTTPSSAHRSRIAPQQSSQARLTSSFFELFVHTDAEMAGEFHDYAVELAKLIQIYSEDGQNTISAEERRHVLSKTLEAWLTLKTKLKTAYPELHEGLEAHGRAVQVFVRLQEKKSPTTSAPRTMLTGGNARFKVPENGWLHELYGKAGPGDVIQVSGTVRHAALSANPQATGTGPIVIRGPATLQMNPSGGSDTLSFKRVGPTRIENLILEPDDRAAVMFNTKTRYRGIHFIQCKVGLASGKGWNPETNTGFKAKWGFLSYELDDFRFEGGEVIGIGKEHCFYHHNPHAQSPNQNAILIRDATLKWAGRTAVQVVARAHEGVAGQGNVTIDNCQIEDVCLEDGGGGSALTFRGNLDGTVLVRNTSVHLGGNPRLDPKLGRNITGALVMDTGSGSKGHGTRELIIENCHFEIGPAYTGKGSARRNNVDISQVRKLKIIGTTILNHPGSAGALHIGAPSIDEIILDDDNDVRGDCSMSGLGVFKDPRRDGSGYRAMLRAIEEARQKPESDPTRIIADKIEII